MKAKELVDKIRNNKIAIYGTGYVAKKFYDVLVEKNLTDNLVFFITSDGGKSIDGYDVLSIDSQKIDDSILILVAVHESIRDEIIESLEVRNYHNYIWIYPELYELILGEALEKDIDVPLKKIWLANRENYWMAVRYLAVDNYFGKNTFGYDIYKMAMSLYSNPQTCERRLQQFIKLIESWKNNGYNRKKPSMILDNYNYVDGAHRISLASYFGQEYIVCNIYSSMHSKDMIHNKKVIFCKSLVQELNMDEEVVKILEETNQRIDKQYNLN